jgi:hypothetical protein
MATEIPTARVSTRVCYIATKYTAHVVGRAFVLFRIHGSAPLAANDLGFIEESVFICRLYDWNLIKKLT